MVVTEPYYFAKLGALPPLLLLGKPAHWSRVFKSSAALSFAISETRLKNRHA